MSDPDFVILYVDNAQASTTFYADLLGKPPVNEVPGFAVFALTSGLQFGLWERSDVQPAVNGARGGGEIVFPLGDATAVDALHEDWRGRGLPIAQTPTDLGFGRTFVALDPDGHRLRAYARPQAAS